MLDRLRLLKGTTRHGHRSWEPGNHSCAGSATRDGARVPGSLFPNQDEVEPAGCRG